MTTRHVLTLLGILLAAALVTIELQRWEEQQEARRRALEQAQRGEQRSAKQERKGGEAAAPVDEERHDAVEPALERPEAVRREDDTHRLQERIAELDAELARLRAELEQLRRELAAAREELRHGDVRRRQMADHLAANPLVHAELWRDLYEAVLDGETVTADPARILPPLLALARATGVANAELDEGTRRVHPEPSAPECELALAREDAQWKEDDGGGARVLESRGVQFEVRLELPKKPDGWQGAQLSLSVSLDFSRRSDGASSFRIDIDGPGSVGGSDSEIHLNHDADGRGSIWRKPHQGDLDAHDLAPGEFHELQQRLIAVYEELCTLAG